MEFKPTARWFVRRIHSGSTANNGSAENIANGADADNGGELLRRLHQRNDGVFANRLPFDVIDDLLRSHCGCGSGSSALPTSMAQLATRDEIQHGRPCHLRSNERIEERFVPGRICYAPGLATVRRMTNERSPARAVSLIERSVEGVAI